MMSSSSTHLHLTSAQADLLQRLGANLDCGLSTQQANDIRRKLSARSGNSGSSSNVVTPPVNCPAWICCLLPCIKSIPSMKVFRQLQPDDAEVLRNNRWIRYDATALVPGDLIRLDETDRVPADCIVLALLLQQPLHHHQINQSKGTTEGGGPESSHGSNIALDDELLVDHRPITGEEKPRSSSVIILPSHNKNQKQSSSQLVPVPASACCCPDRFDGFWTAARPTQLFYGGQVLQGCALCVVTAIGSQTLIAARIRQGNFPAKSASTLAAPAELTLDTDGTTLNADEEAGIALIGRETV